MKPLALRDAVTIMGIVPALTLLPLSVPNIKNALPTTRTQENMSGLSPQSCLLSF